MDHDLNEIEQAREREHYSLDPRDQPFADDESWRDEPAPEQDDTSWLDSFDIATLNAARTVLTKLGEMHRLPEVDPNLSMWERDFKHRAIGHAQGLAEHAEETIFGLLNYAKHHLGIEVTDKQLFNRDDAEV